MYQCHDHNTITTLVLVMELYNFMTHSPTIPHGLLQYDLIL